LICFGTVVQNTFLKLWAYSAHRDQCIRPLSVVRHD